MDLDKLTNEEEKILATGKLLAYCDGHDGEEIAYPFIDGYAAVYLGKDQAYRSDVHKGQFALIDKTGKILNGKKYDSLNLIYLEPMKPSYEARLGDKLLTLDTKGNILKEEKY